MSHTTRKLIVAGTVAATLAAGALYIAPNYMSSTENNTSDAAAQDEEQYTDAISEQGTPSFLGSIQEHEIDASRSETRQDVDNADDATVTPARNNTPPLPSCELRDDPTEHNALKDWQNTLLDHQYRLPQEYAPKDLVPVSEAGLPGGGYVRAIIIDDLKKMARAAKKADAEIAVASAFRSYTDQQIAFGDNQRKYGREHAIEASARPGHSEHQLGTSLDVRSANSLRDPWAYNDWGTTPAGTWMRKNSWKYGFILSYPKGKTEQTCYMYESWHFRYVGKEAAQEIHDRGITLREYLWEQQTHD
ncbi:M15 family metallopeptidase [Timonella sp. A28]|uniref:M15 family metallopeptidase n=1 Tax=Timonella sp. A28 TaxID=3442640 RepID=UPI003EBEED14